MTKQPLNFLCITCFYKGADFLKACHAAGNNVFLVTKQSLEHADWPHESIKETFYMESDANSPQNFQALLLGLAHLFRHTRIDHIVALDDFDVEKAAFLREEFRVPGMGQTTARYFRDKLAMRMQAADKGIRVPEFSPLFNDADINHFIEQVPGPWVVKPRAEASATGIKKIHHADEVWPHLHSLGENRHQYLIESFKPGDVYHADTLSAKGEIQFCRVSKYLNTPFEVAHGGGIFRTQTVPFGSEDDRALQEMTAHVMDGFGMRSSASHTEYIKAHEDGQFYFLETSSRVGGAHIAEMVEASSGINLWYEWARLEDAIAKDHLYQLPEAKQLHAGILVSLSRFQHPDMSVFDAPEVVWKIQKEHHVGMIIRSEDREQVSRLLDEYAERVFRDFHASAPAPDHPMD
jgi:biotin carboxylase